MKGPTLTKRSRLYENSENTLTKKNCLTTNRLISISLGTHHPWVKEIQVNHPLLKKEILVFFLLIKIGVFSVLINIMIVFGKCVY